MNMPSNGEQRKAILGRREKLVVIVLAQYALAFLSGLVCTAAIFLAFGPFNALLTANNATSLLAVSLPVIRQEHGRTDICA